MIIHKIFSSLFQYLSNVVYKSPHLLHALCRTYNMYDALYALALAEDTIWPEKYRVEGNPPMNEFPSSHPNKRRQQNVVVKDEL